MNVVAFSGTDFQLIVISFGCPLFLSFDGLWRIPKCSKISADNVVYWWVCFVVAMVCCSSPHSSVIKFEGFSWGSYKLPCYSGMK
jgi:hypothetical protein